MKNLLIAQSGGPSAAINATLAGAIEKGLESVEIDKIYGALYGVKGILEENLIELTDTVSSKAQLDLLSQTPSSALGSCRLKLKGIREYEKILSVFRKFEIGYFVYIGGNDSMDTVYQLSKYCADNNITDIKIMGAPKTIDNDLCETDHCPGFGSAAKYIATTFSELGQDCSVYDVEAVTLVEVMGRNAGWLTAASALARINGGSSPDLIYVCERAFSVERFLEDVQKKLSEKPYVVVAVSEGVKNEFGEYIAESVQSKAVDAFGHKFLSGAANYLKEIVNEKIGCKVRAIELNLMQRCASHIASETDICESKMLGSAAVTGALEGRNGEMVALKRTSENPYQTEVIYADISKIANFEKIIPNEWITADGNDVTEELIAYILPLIQGEMPITYKNGVPLHIVI